MRRMSSQRVLGPGVLLALAGAGLAACDGAEDEVEQETRFQCAIDRGGVEEAVDCDDVDDSTGFVYVGSTYHPVFIHSAPATGTYRPGQSLPTQNRHRIGYRDAAGRQQWGLPPSGKIANNYTTKVNVVGKGGAPAKAGGGVGGKAGGAGS